MTVVVSDTSPIRALDFLRRLETLPILFGNILLPPAVVDELARTSDRFRPIRVTDYDYLQMRAASDTGKVSSLLPTIDRGEAEAIVLAREVGADAILIDEADGRRVARQQYGLRVVWTLGILLSEKQRGMVPAVRPQAHSAFAALELARQLMKRDGRGLVGVILGVVSVWY
ncbi:MAG: DUF3368 domain-containing protein [Planctomycetota bacterium]